MISDGTWMLRLVCVVTVLAGAGCKNGSPPGAGAAGSGSGSAHGGGAAAGSGSAVAAAPVDAGTDAAVGAAATPGLAFDTGEDGDTGLAIAFDHKVPRLPAVSSDGASIATFESSAGMPMQPSPMSVVIRRLDGAGKRDELDVVDTKLADDAVLSGANWAETPPAAAVVKVLRGRATAALDRLRAGGFATLDPVELPGATYDEPVNAKIGALAFSVKPPLEGDPTVEALDVTLRDARGAILHHERVRGYQQGTFNGGDGQVACVYRPVFRAAFQDTARRNLYVELGFRWHEECDPSETRYLVWSLPVVARPSPEVEAIAKVVDAQFDRLHRADDADAVFTADAQLTNPSGLGEHDSLAFHVIEASELYAHHTDKDVQISVARDGKSAWASLSTQIEVLPRNQAGRSDPWRASDVLVKTAAGWRIAAASWTQPMANAAVNRDAKAGKLPALPALDGDPGDAGLRAAFARLITDGLDPVAATRADLVAFGSGPGERTVGGAALAAGWNAGWKRRVTVTSSLARVTPSGTTGWVIANVRLAKGSGAAGYQIPFQLFCVFDKTASGEWSLVHVHFAV